MIKNHAKLFEEFLIGEDEIDDLLPSDDKKDGGKEDSKKDDKKDGDKKEEKPDPIKKLQDEEKKKEKKSDEKFEEYMKKKEAELEKSFDEVPDIKDEIGEETITAVKSHDRTKIHVAYNNLIYLQSKYEKAGSTDKVQQISRIKDVMDELDRTFTSGKHM